MAYAYYTLPAVPVLAGLSFGTVYTPMPCQIPQLSPLSQDEIVSGEIPKTCARCGVLYKREEDIATACHIHPGSYRDSHTFSDWSCCKKPLRTATGCKPVPHLEDQTASDQLRKYMYLTTQAESKRTVTPSMMPGSSEGPGYGKKKVIKADNAPKDGLIVHTVLSTDTLEGISLKYDVSKTDLFRANRGLSTSGFPAWRKIMIPIGDAEVILTEMLSPEEKKALEEERLRIKFSRQFKITIEEASAYLASHDYDYDKAALDHKEDMAFEVSLADSSASSIFSSRSTKFTPVVADSKLQSKNAPPKKYK
jgi:hypothetical protein